MNKLWVNIDPYKIRLKQRLAWLWCWKIIKKKDTRYDNNIAKKIALLIPADFTNVSYWSRKLVWLQDNSLSWCPILYGDDNLKIASGNRIPCHQCLMPTNLGPFYAGKLREETCARGHIRTRNDITCECGLDFMLPECVDKIIKLKNLILPDKKIN